MNKLRHKIFLTLFTLGVVAGNDSVLDSKYKLKNNKKLRETFNKLIYSVTSVNEERLNALKKFHALQNYLPQVSRAGGTPIIAIFTAKQNNNDPEIKFELNNRGTDDAPSDNPEINLLKLIGKLGKINKRNEKVFDFERVNSNEDKLSLRQWKSCTKKAIKACTKACKRAFKDICSDYKCSRSMKRSARKRCKTACRSKFENDD